MTNKEKLLFGVIIAAILLVAGFVVYRVEVQTAADMATLRATIKQQDDVVASLQKQISDRDAQAKAKDDALQKEADAAKTVQAQLALIASRLSLPQPVTVTLPPASTPNAPVTVSAPPQDIQAAVDYTTKCEQCKVDVVTLKADLTDVKSQLSAVGKERDAAVSAANGGTKWLRFKRAAKWIVLGGAIGAAAGYAAKR